MVFKFITLCASLAVVNAGYAPLAYSSAPSVSYSTFTSGVPASSVVPLTKTLVSAAPAVTTYAAHPQYTQAYHPVAAPVEAISSTHQNTVRTFDGTVSHHSKAIDTAYASVRKSDTRVSNNVYTPTLAAATTYHTAAAPALTTYAAPAYHTAAVPTYHSAAPALHTTYHSAAPAVHATTYHAAAPAVATTYHAAAPAVATTYHSAAPALATTYHSATPAVATTYHSAAPAVATTYHSAAPALATTYSAAAPKALTYSSAPLVAHVSFEGHGAQYAW